MAADVESFSSVSRLTSRLRLRILVFNPLTTAPRSSGTGRRSDVHVWFESSCFKHRFALFVAIWSLGMSTTSFWHVGHQTAVYDRGTPRGPSVNFNVGAEQV